MLYSLGKDSSVLLHIAKKAFWPKKTNTFHCYILILDGNLEKCMIKNRLIESEEVEVITYKNERTKKLIPLIMTQNQHKSNENRRTETSVE